MLQRNFIYLRSGNLDGFNVDPWVQEFQANSVDTSGHSEAPFERHMLCLERPCPFGKYISEPWNQPWKQQNPEVACNWQRYNETDSNNSHVESQLWRRLLSKRSWEKMIDIQCFNNLQHMSVCAFWKRHEEGILLPNYKVEIIFCHDIPTQLSGGGKSNISSWGIPENLLENKNSSVWQH